MEFDGGCIFGKFSRTLLERGNTKESPTSMMMYYVIVNPNLESIHDSFEPFLESRRICKEMGSIDGARMALFTYISGGFFAGRDLRSMNVGIEEFKEEMSVIP